MRRLALRPGLSDDVLVESPGKPPRWAHPGTPGDAPPARPRALSRRSGAGADPAVLLVGAGEKFQAALTGALAQHKVFVETTPVEAVVDTVVAAAPDLILLVGDAAQDCGSHLNRVEFR